ncbi:MAG: glycosyltransferase family 2 protein [Actinobacteria bacterium]|nr:glycosyltransferase family 2 protein [Actinomycetota bacterium]MDQ3533863.1 glycosyltransferase family 2 protein [Actinomycetota bacterium]
MVTVVIPARNEEEFIGPCLESVLAQSESDLEVLVVDGASEDRTKEIVKDYVTRDSRVHLLHNPAGIISRSLNLALARACGQWFVRVDAHSTIPPDYVVRVVNHLKAGQWGGVGGRKDGVGKTAAGRAIAAAMGSRFGGGNSTYHYGTMAQTVDHIPFGAYPTDLVRELSGWDERFPVNQDYEFDYRVRQSGRELLFDPEIRIDWHCRQKISDLFLQYRRYGRDKARVALLVPESLKPRHLAAPCFVAVAVFAILSGLRFPRPMVRILGPYVLVVVGTSATMAKSLEQPQDELWLLAAFPAMHIGWGLGFWQGILRDLTLRSTTLKRPVLADQTVLRESDRSNVT